MEQPSPRSRFGLARGDPTKILDSRLLFLARLVILGLQVTVTVFIALRDNTVWVSLSFIANVAQLAAAAVSTLATLVSAVTGVDGATARHLRAVAGPAVLVTGALSTTAALALAVLAERASYAAVETLGAPVAAKLAAATALDCAWPPFGIVAAFVVSAAYYAIARASARPSSAADPYLRYVNLPDQDVAARYAALAAVAAVSAIGIYAVGATAFWILQFVAASRAQTAADDAAAAGGQPRSPERAGRPGTLKAGPNAPQGARLREASGGPQPGSRSPPWFARSPAFGECAAARAGPQMAGAVRSDSGRLSEVTVVVDSETL